jgi:hypothetical protein
MGKGCDNCSGCCNNSVFRYCGSDITCMGITKDDTYEEIVQKLANALCDIEFEDGQGIDHIIFTSTTHGGGQQGQPGETDTYTVWGDVDETVNLGTFVITNGSGAVFVQTTDSTAVTNTITTTSITTTGGGSVTFAANSFSIGDVIRGKIAGALGVGVVVNLTVDIKLGSVVLASSGAVAMPTITAKQWSLNFDTVVRTTGASGTFNTNAVLEYQKDGTNESDVSYFQNSVAIDTTAAHDLDVEVTWSVADASNTIDSDMFILEKL